ncbi:hypothetical protein THIOM_004362 [Candidatus Thiomargarita nelsonii]|uniref:Uncharacterized protein n=1 Tax=Candidatus Thiomargarita nelsonii TaxID=1003181 RepID=A0A0A6RKY9_9GAMM|nr:hypothetical protein THIOM_004362 [Candidatus Thiomargarita nelsonii]
MPPSGACFSQLLLEWREIGLFYFFFCVTFYLKRSIIKPSLLTLTITKPMENTIEQNIPTQTLHLAVDIEIPSKTEFNQQTIQQVIKLLLQNHSQAFCSNSPEQILQNLGVKDETSSPNEWEQMLQRLKQPPMTLEQRKIFDESRQEFRENFFMPDIHDSK